MKQSETKIIKRSQINLNPYNPKRHTDEQVKLQKANLKKVGFLGGIVWNEASGNLIDGHRRIKALDIINKYDGTPATDYEVKVEAVQMDEKTELQQMTYMAVGNSKADYNLIAPYVEQIDYSSVGLSDAEYNEILKLRQTESVEAIPSWDADFGITELEVQEKSNEEVQQEIQDKPKMTKEQVKAEKQKCDDVAAKHHEEKDLYIILNFDNEEMKQAFCELLGISDGPFLNLRGEPVRRLLDMMG